MSSDIVDPDELVSFAMAGDGGTQALWTLYNNPTVNRLARQAAQTADRKTRLRSTTSWTGSTTTTRP